MSSQILPSFHLLHSKPTRIQKVGIMSRISRVLFPYSSPSKTSSPSRDRLSGVDSLAGMTQEVVVVHAKQEKEYDDKNKTKRRSRRNKPQSRVQMSSSEALGNSLMNIGQCPVVEKKKEMNSSKSRIRTLTPSRKSTNPFGIFASLGNLNPPLSFKKNHVSFVVEQETNSKSERDERQRKRAASRGKSLEKKSPKPSKRNQRQVQKSKVSNENDCMGIVSEFDHMDVVSPVSVPRKRMDSKLTPVQIHDQNEVYERRSKKLLEQEILSPSVAPKPLKRIDNRATPDLKICQPQMRVTETSYSFDEIHTHAQAVLKATEQARSIVSVTDISNMSPTEIECIAKIQAKAIVVANPELSVKPSLEELNRHIDLQTKALIYAYTSAFKSQSCMSPNYNQTKLSSEVIKPLEKDAVDSPERCSNTDKHVMTEQNLEDKVSLEKKKTSNESSDNIVPAKEIKTLGIEFSEVFNSLDMEQKQDHEANACKKIDSILTADDDRVTEACITSVEGNDEEEHRSQEDDVKSCTFTKQKVETEANHRKEKSEYDSLQQQISVDFSNHQTKQTDSSSGHDQLQHSSDIQTSQKNERNEYKSYVGRRVVGYFPRFKKYYHGTVVNFYQNDDEVIFRIKYDDGDEEFINYSDDNAIEGRDLKRLLENFDKYGEGVISKPKDKKKQKKAKKAIAKAIKENECNGNELNVSQRPRRHVKQVDRLELTFRRKKKKQSETTTLSDGEQNIQMDETLKSLEITNDCQTEEVEDMNNNTFETSNCNSRRYGETENENNKKNEERVSSNETHENTNLETNEYVKRMEGSQLELTKQIEKLTMRQNNKGSRGASCTTSESKENIPRRSARNRKSAITTYHDHLSDDEDNKQKCEILPDKIIVEEMDKDGWTPTSITLLKKAYGTIDPLASNFWGRVAKTVGGKTGEECRDKWFELFNVNDTKSKLSSRSNALHIGSEDEQNEDDIFNSTPYRENRMKIHLDSSSQSRKPLSRLSDILTSPIFNRLNAKKKIEGSVDGENDTPRRFRSQYKSYVKEIKAGAFGKSKRTRDKKKVPQLQPKSRLYASAEAGEIQMRGLVSPGGTLKLEEPDIDEIENAFLDDDELDSACDDCSIY